MFASEMISINEFESRIEEDEAVELPISRPPEEEHPFSYKLDYHGDERLSNDEVNVTTSSENSSKKKKDASPIL